jgi:hypothetical protein
MYSGNAGMSLQAGTHAVASAACVYLHGVHGNVDAAIQQGVIDLLGEQTLATDVSQGNVQNLVTGSLDDDNLQSTLLSQLGEASLRANVCYSSAFAHHVYSYA